MKSTEVGNSEELQRGLKNRHVQLIAIGGAIGTGLFLGSGKSIHFAGPSIILAYLITGLMLFLVMRALGELLMSNLKYHSFVDFVNEYFGEGLSFVTGWTYWFCWVCMAMGDLTALGVYMKLWFPHLAPWIPGLIAVIVLCFLNLLTVKLFGEIEFWFALIKVVAIIALIIIGIVLIVIGFKTPNGGHATVTNLWSHGFFGGGFRGFLLSFQMVVFAFTGIELVGLTAAETKNPKKVIPNAINSIPIRIIIFYVGSLIVIMCISPWKSVNASQSPFVHVFSIIGITSAAAIINFVVSTAAASATNSALFSTSRMTYSLASEKNAPKCFGKLSSRKVPSNSLFFSAIIIAVAVVLNYLIPNAATVFTLVTSVSTVCFIFIWGITVVCGILYLKRKPESAAKNTFKMPFRPFSNYIVLAFLICVIVVLALAEDTRLSLFITPIWFIILAIAYNVKKRSKNKLHSNTNTKKTV